MANEELVEVLSRALYEVAVVVGERPPEGVGWTMSTKFEVDGRVVSQWHRSIECPNTPS